MGEDMTRTSNSNRILGKIGRTTMQMGAIFLLLVLIFAPFASAGIGGTISGNIYNSNSYTLGQATVDLYNFVRVNTPDSANPLQSNWLDETEKLWNTNNPTTIQPGGIPFSSSVYSDSTATNTQPTGLVMGVSDQTDNAFPTNSQPLGVAGIAPQFSDSKATNVGPLGSAPVNTQNANTGATNIAPSGTTATISAQIDDSASTNLAPAGVTAAIAPQIQDGGATNVKPTGISDSTPQTGDTMPIFVAPPGTAAISANSADAGSTSVQPTGAPASQSGIWYIGLMVIEADDDGDSVVDDTIFWVLTDVAVSGTYDTMSLSYEDASDYSDGNLGDQYVGVGDDEEIGDGETVTLETYDFVVNFASDPASASPDAWITSSEWYEGAFSIDLNGDGTIGANEAYNYSMADTNSDGIYDTFDISTDDTTYGEGGALGDGLSTIDNDERVTSIMPVMSDVRLSTHNFKVSFWENPFSSPADAAIWSWEWYTGSVSFDFDGDGIVDINVVEFCLSDRNSDGVYDRVDVTENTFPNYEEGDLGDLFVTFGDDEASTDTDPDGISVALGMYNFNISFNTAPFATNPDFWIRSDMWAQGTMTLEGEATDVGTSDIDSDGLFDRFYIDLSPWPGGDGDFADANEGPYLASDTISDGNLLLDYDVATIYDAPPSFPFYMAELRPTGATVGSTAQWAVGQIELPSGSGSYYTVAISDNNGDLDADTVDIDIDGDKQFGVGDLLDGDDGYDGSATAFTIAPDNFYIIRVDPLWGFVNIIRNPWGLIPIFDYRNNVFEPAWGWPGGEVDYTYGIADEAGIIDYNGDFDMTDQFYWVCVDSDGDGTYDGVYLDQDQNSNLGDGRGWHFLPNGMPPWPFGGPGPFNYGLYALGDAIDLFSPAWPGRIINSIAADGSSFSFNVGPPLIAAGTETVSRSSPNPLDTSERYISPLAGILDPASFGMTQPSAQNANGAATIIQPGGISWNSGMGSSSTSTGTQPTGSATISSNGFDAGVTSTAPPGVPGSLSGFWYFGIFQLDTDADGVADDIVNWVLTDVGFPGTYDLLSLSYDWSSFADANPWDGYLGPGDDEWLFIGPGFIQFETYFFSVAFDSDPTADSDDTRITSTTWFEGMFNIDANDDADASDYIYYVLSDSDSDGVYDTMDISCEDQTYGEGGALGNGIVNYLAPGDNTDDERITASSDVTLGDSFLYTVTFDGGPLLDFDDARIQSKEWYEGTFTIDADDDGVADNSVNFAVSDMNSDGLYDVLHLSLDDTTYEEGALTDASVTDPDNDERIQTVIHDNFDGVSLGSPSWDTSIGASGFTEWWPDTSQGQYNTGITSYWCGAPNPSDPAIWPPGSTPPGVGTGWDEELKLLSVDLNSASTATLTFEHYYNFVDFGFDGGNVHISTASQFGPWTLLTPVGGYDANLDPLVSSGEDAYSGTNGGWTTASFDLSAYTGNTIWLRWRTVTSTDGFDDEDGFSDGDGWFIDDVSIQTGRYITIGPSFEFLTEFDLAPNTDGDDARILSNTWHEGSFLIDGNGDGFVFEVVRYALTDTDSDGVYEAMDLSIDDVIFGEGIVNDNLVNWVLGGNDERITTSEDITIGTFFLFTVEFDGGPNVDADDARITSKEWYQSSFIIDADGDGIASEQIYFVLTDTDSDGAYQAMDISMNATYGEGNLLDKIVDSSGSGNDELITASTAITLGDYYLFMTGFDAAPNWDLTDARIRNQEWYEGTFTIDADDSGAADDTVDYVLSDTNSDGLYDTIDISLDDASPVYGEGAISDSTVNWVGVGNDERVSIAILDQFDGTPIGNPIWWDAIGGSGFIEWNLDTSQGQFSSGVTSYWCGAPNVNDPAAWPPGSTPPGYGLNWDEELKLFGVNLLTANDAVMTFEHYYNMETSWDGGAVYISTFGPFGPWTLLTPEEGYDGPVNSLGTDGYTGNSGGWSTATFDLDPYVGNFIFVRWRLTEDGLFCDEDGGWDGDGWFIDDVTILTNRLITLGNSYEFNVEFDHAPNIDVDDADITSNEWYVGDWSLDADDVDDDGFPDDIAEYVLTDTDSDGLYDTMDISLNDDEFGETGGGGLSDGIVDYDWDGSNLDDEQITASTNVTIGDSLLFNVEFDANPNNVDADDARINNIEWYEGTFSIDLDGDGIVDPDSVNYVLSDVSSWGVYQSFMDISVDDTTYGEGNFIDQIATTDNDEVIWNPGGEYVYLGAYNYHVQSFDQLYDGLEVNDGVNYDTNDARIRISHWFWGTALLEGILREAVVADSDSDGEFDEIYIDVNGNDNWGDVGVDAIGVPVGGTFQGSELELQYSVVSIDPQGQTFEIQPTGASAGLTTSWFVGQIEAPSFSGNWYDVVLSDTDDDSIFETADFDIDFPGDSVVDATGLTETSGLVPLGPDLYQVINIDDWGWNVRIISYIDSILGPANDISLTDTIHYGVVRETDLTLNLNQDGDITDIYRTIVVDNVFFGMYQTVFIDTDSDDDLSSEPPLSVGSVFSISSPAPMIDHEFDIDYIEFNGNFYAFKQINHPIDTFVTDADGYYSLSTAIDGNYWLSVTNGGSSWGYGTMSDTNSGQGISITGGDYVDDWNEYLAQIGSFIFGYVNDSVTLNPIAGAQVEVYDASGSIVISTQTKADGSYQLAVLPAPGYDMVYSFPGYYTDDGRSTGTWQNLLVVGDIYSRDVLLVADTIPPTITLDYPLEGRTVSGIRTVAATASDDFLLEAVEVSFDLGANYFSMTNVGGNNFAFIWDTTAYSEGQYRVTVRATDNAGLTDSEYVDIYVTNDATAPTVSVVSPSNNDFIEGTYTIQILALDNHALEFVNVSVGGVDYQATYNAITGYYEHPLDTTAYGDGLNSLDARATDYAGNFAIDTFLTGVNIDNTHPTLWINTPSQGETVYNLVSIDCDSVDSGAYVPTVEYKIDSGTWTTLTGTELVGWTDSWDSTTVSNGVHTIWFRTYDAIGHVTTDSITVTVDNDYPVATIVAPLTDEYVQGTYTFQVLATDDVQVSSVYVTINGVDYDCAYNSASGFWEVSVDTTTIADEIYDVYANVWDSVPGHWDVSGLVDFYIDNTHPTLSITSPSDGETVYGSVVDIEADSVDVGASFDPVVEYKIDSGAWIALTGSEILGWTDTWDSTAFANGLHTIHIRSYDPAGHITTDSVTVTVDNDDPQVSVVAPLASEYIEGTYTFSIAASDEITLTNVYATIDVTQHVLGYNSASGYWEVTIDTTTLPEGVHTITATAEDGIPAHSQTTVALNFNVDNLDPVLSINSPTPGQTVSGSTVSIDADCYDEGISVPWVVFRIDSGPWITLAGSEALGWTALWDSTSVSNGAHTLTFRASDAIGHEVTDSVDIIVDNDNPTVNIVAPIAAEYVQGTYTFIVAATDAIQVQSVYITINAVNYIMGYNSASGYWEVTVDTTTILDGTWGITATVSDGVPAHTQTSVSFDFDIDNNAPTLSVNSPTNGETVTGNLVLIDVDSTDSGSFSPTVEYRIDSGPWTTLTGSEILGWTTIWDSTTASNGAHTLHFRAYDGIGHFTFDSIHITVDNDNPLVSIVAPVVGEYLQGTYTFKVSASDSIGITNVYITINGIDYTAGYNSASGFWEVTVDTLTISDGTYGITATAEDGIPSHTQTTTPFNFNIDNNAPVLSINAPWQGALVSGSVVLIDATATDVADLGLTVQYRIDSGAWIDLTGSEILGWTDSWDTTLVSNGVHTVSFRAFDTIGHVVTDSVTVTVDNDNPAVSVVAPLLGEFIQGTYTFRVTATDIVGLTNVYITINGQDYTAGYNSASGFWEVVMDSETIADGTYSISATAEDGIPGHEQTSTPLEFNIDNNAPTLSINYPTNGETVFGNLVSVDVSSTDVGVFVPTVQYRVDRGSWITLTGDEILGWTDSWDTTTHLNMVHTLTFRAYDQIGHMVYETMDLTVDNDNPLVSIITPLSGEFVENSYSFKVAASDDIGVTNVYVTISGIDYTAGFNSASGYWEVDIDSTTFADGGYSITATAEDGIPAHTQVTSATTFNMDNNPPTLTINYPVPGAHVRGDITFNVLGSDTFLDRVEYSVDGTGWVLIGTLWDSSIFNDGSHSVTFRALDLAGHVTSETILVIVDNADTDSDGIGDLEDWDIDNDGFGNDVDAFPFDDLEWIDTDLDGIGNNADMDDDGDGVSDALDDFALNENEWIDTDSDGIGDNADFDDDGDGIPDVEDPFPKNGTEWIDTDSDGIGDNVDLDDDGDGVIDTEDDFPKNPDEYVDTDLDGVGDNADSDDDGDGVIDVYDAFPLDPTETIDTDSDGIGNNADLDDDGDGVLDADDLFPLDPDEYLDTDSDGIGDSLDSDIDGDGIININDAFPRDFTEYIDTDLDGVGDNADLDDDGDNVADTLDLFPLNFREYMDTDSDGIGDASDIDDDGDLFPDFNDAFPMDPTETSDLDRDGIGDNADLDRDGDGFQNSADIFPDDNREWADNDKDGIGDNADPDDDNDGVSDLSDYSPLDKDSNLPPFWWWWIPFAALITLAILVYFITNKRQAGTLPDEDAIKKKYEDIQEESYDQPHPAEKIRAPALPKSNIPMVYTASELEGMKKSQLVKVAKEMGLSIAGTKSDLTTRINVAQADTTMEGIMQTLEDFDCPSCGKTLRVETAEAPMDWIFGIYHN
jgi:hypothetical protein